MDTFNTCVRDDIESCSELYKAFIHGLQAGYEKMCGVYRSGESYVTLRGFNVNFYTRV